MTVALKAITFEGEKGTWIISTGLDKGCGLCIEKCPKKCLSWSKTQLGVYGTPTVEADMKECIACGICETVCPDCAIKVVKKK